MTGRTIQASPSIKLAMRATKDEALREQVDAAALAVCRDRKWIVAGSWELTPAGEKLYAQLGLA